MELISSKEREIVINIDRIIDTSREVGSPVLADEKIGNVVSLNGCCMPENNKDEISPAENSKNLKTVDDISPLKVNSKREKGKLKKSPKPPRPPRSFLSLDAADQKLIKEIAELTNIKRAKIERMKKMRAAKATSSSSGNLIALLFTLILFGVILIQGCQFSHGNKSSVSVGSGVPLTSIESPNIMQPIKQRNI